MKRSREPEGSTFNTATPEPHNRELDAPSPKIRELDCGGEGGTASPFRCTLHPQPVVFRDYDDYHAHYNKQHVNRCHECRKNLPSDHLLSVHIEECHDAFLTARRDKGQHTYSCFVEGCDRKCRDPSKRRRHLIDKHMYPPNFFFDVVRYGIDGRQSLLCDVNAQQRHLKPKSDRQELQSGATLESEKQFDDHNNQIMAANVAEGVAVLEPVETQPAEKDIEMNDAASLTGSMSALKLVPRSIMFGRSGRRGFTRSPSPRPPPV
ncbi:C2H2 type zinc finger domain-containing protein [Pyricularia oryzae]|uniref:C2H2 type zinc finger domain-containing protein n=2 Tax=Pyricularia oryzae TaxID=318829 RepID=A0AA97PKF7_PYRO3|nr:C2H2 type zinc finger domain-containing protein [Pyricularia oryzae Y34]KAI7925832.1 C2H2 type zinc finger domain-containing protein [Pyricularia oryzae]KAI7927117.1 C2H2 type zinc finger domain-containing protein [Pyricularia oryzae]